MLTKNDEMMTFTSVYVTDETSIRVDRREHEDIVVVIFGREEGLVLEFDEEAVPRFAAALAGIPPRVPDVAR